MYVKMAVFEKTREISSDLTRLVRGRMIETNVTSPFQVQ